MGTINCKETITTRTTHTSDDQGVREIFKSKSENDEFIEGVVCKVNEISDNEMKQFDLGENGKILLVKKNDKFFALGTKCSHYGAPLHTGVLSDNRIRCPWHGACFNLETGDIEDFPGLDSIPCYKTRIDKGEVIVTAKKNDLEKNKRIQFMHKRLSSDSKTYVIVGGGPAGGVAAETLRQEGFVGRIVMICKEHTLPYDRPKLTKNIKIDVSTINFRNQEFYDQYSIETLLGVEATELDTEKKTVTCSNGYVIKYDKILIATGGRAVKAPIPGSDLANIFTIRSFADVNEINKIFTENSNVICLGSSFIALEAAAYFAGKVKSISLIGRENVPLKVVFGEKIGERIKTLFEENGVNMIMNNGIEKCNGTGGKISSIELKDGSNLPCDILIMGTGTKLNTDFVKNSGININANGSIDADDYLMSNIQDVYVCGDIANAPIYSNSEQKATIGHYQLAQYHGKVAATNMCGKNLKLNAVPFFWTMIFGKSFRYSGYGKFEEVLITGSLDKLEFIAYYLDKSDKVVAITACSPLPVVAAFAELKSKGIHLGRHDLEDSLAWMSKLKD